MDEDTKKIFLSREAFMAMAGLGIAFLLYLFLSISRKIKARKESEERVQNMRDESHRQQDSPPGTTPYFVAHHGGNGFFRVYCAPGELLFLAAGQYFPLIDPESVRANDDRHWLMRSMKMTMTAVGTVIAFGLTAQVFIGRAVARNAGQNPEGAGHILMIVTGSVGLFALIVSISVPAMLWMITRRCRELDQLSLCELRELAELDPKSLRVTPEYVSEIKITAIKKGERLMDLSQAGCHLNFLHKPTGRWRIDTSTNADCKAAIRACLKIWGPEGVEIDSVLAQKHQQ